MPMLRRTATAAVTLGLLSSLLPPTASATAEGAATTTGAATADAASTTADRRKLARLLRALPAERGGPAPEAGVDALTPQSLRRAVVDAGGCPAAAASLADGVEVTWSSDPGRTVEAVEISRRAAGATGEPRLVATLAGDAQSYRLRSTAAAGSSEIHVTVRYTDGSQEACPAVVGTAAEVDAVGSLQDEVLWQSPAGGEASAALALDGYASTPVYSPDGRQVVFAYAPDGGSRYDLYVRAANGTGEPVRLTATPDVEELYPAWSPDGRSVVVTAYNPDDITHLVKVDVATGASTALNGGDEAAEGVVMPDGSVVATDLSDENAPLLRIAPDGSRSWVYGTLGGMSPAVSPDGAHLAYVRVDVPTDGGPYVDSLVVVPAAGARRVVVASSETDTYWQPAWHPGQQRFWWPAEPSALGAAWTWHSVAGDGTGLRIEDAGLPDANHLSFRRPTRPATSDFTGDGVADVLARGADGRLNLYPRLPGGGWGPRRTVGSGWNGMTAIVAAGDVSGDGNADVVARSRDGKLWLYTGSRDVTRTASWGLPQLIGGGWQHMTAIVAAGDVTGDGRADLLARHSDGRLLRYEGNGRGGFTPGATQVGWGWHVFTDIVGFDDVTGDGLGDVVAKDAGGRVLLYPSDGRGGLGAKVGLGTGWQARGTLVSVDGSPTRPAAILARDAAGGLWEHRLGETAAGELPRHHLAVASPDAGKVGSGWQGFTAITG